MGAGNVNNNDKRRSSTEAEARATNNGMDKHLTS
jgi:hypothetical protein